jgi:hypothetical protein
MQAVDCKDHERVLCCAQKLVIDGLLLGGRMEPPSWWSRERLVEQYEEQERTKKQKAASLSQAARNIDRALAGVKPAPAKPAPTPDNSVKEVILRFVARQWPGIAPETIKPKTFTTAARKDEQFLREFKLLRDEVGDFPSRFQISRALGRRE